MIIGLSAYAQTGKDHTCVQLKDAGVPVHRFAFADPIKQIVNQMFGWDERHSYGELKEVVDPFWGFSPRKAYQLFGTEFGRNLSPNIWVKMTERQIDLELSADQNAVITDVRFLNEVAFIKERGGIVVSIWSEQTEPTQDEEGNMVFPSGCLVHESESYIKEIRDQHADVVIHNDRDVEYANGIQTLIKQIRNS